ncbi:MAG: hypothetical protein HQ510_01280, partial [Candidatus Marinimicrobia bacterium]|nr:hypothetical protein [Candidatus Neomarinimicrobiota bacterium]
DVGCGCDEPQAEYYYPDGDLDSFGFESGDLFCADLIPNGWVNNSDDCDDGSEWINPDSPEVCDWVDNNCDDVIDEGCTPGDVVMDGVVNVTDLVQMVQFILGNSIPDDYQTWASDINQDSVINVVDIIILVAIILES